MASGCSASKLSAAAEGTPLAPHVAEFFRTWLRKYKNVSRHTERSYAGSFRSLFQYMEEAHRIRPSAILLEDLTEKRILGFITWMRERGNKESTVSTRLCALKSFASYIEHKLVCNLDFCRTISEIDVKRDKGETVKFLEREAVQALFGAAGQCGLRELTILEVLYDSGARAAELVGINTGDVSFPKGGKRAAIKLYGKGRKMRIVKISVQATKTLKLYIRRHSPEPDGPLFLGRCGNRLSTSGLAYIVTKCEQMAREKNPTLFPFKVHPHTLRHSIATHMVRAHVNLETIRLFLGHSSSATTLVYAQVDPASVSEAVELVRNEIISTASPSKEKADDLEAWIQSILEN